MGNWKSKMWNGKQKIETLFICVDKKTTITKQDNQQLNPISKVKTKAKNEYDDERNYNCE